MRFFGHNHYHVVGVGTLELWLGGQFKLWIDNCLYCLYFPRKPNHHHSHCHLKSHHQHHHHMIRGAFKLFENLNSWLKIESVLLQIIVARSWDQQQLCKSKRFQNHHHHHKHHKHHDHHKHHKHHKHHDNDDVDQPASLLTEHASIAIGKSLNKKMNKLF